MGAKKILSYGRSALVILLVLYLILVWMYFKDNARHLTSSGLLLWFVAIPLLFLGAIMALLWWQKRLDKQTNNTPESGDTADEIETIKPPDTYQLFIYSRVCLPEGDSWSDVIDNEDDLTVLSDELTDFDGMPILVKPITRLTDAASLPYKALSDDVSGFDDETFDEDDMHTDGIAALNDTTLRLCSLIYEQLVLSEEVLSALAEHFHQHQQDATQGNSAIHIHPEWQQHYLVSANESTDKENNNEAMTANPAGYLSSLPIYLCVPASADTAFLIAIIKEQLATYGIAETSLSITLITADSNNVADTLADDTTIYEPAEFINKRLISLAQSVTPDLCLMLIADSQISDEWLDDHLYSNQTANIVPTEAGTLLVFFNQAAQDVTHIDANTSILLTEVCTPDPKASDRDHKILATERLNNKRHYLNHLTTIKNLLIDNTLSLSPTNTTVQKTDDKLAEKPKTKSADHNSKTNVALLDSDIIAISDINPSTQPYDISVYMSFLDAFIAQGALVNEHHLGHYMPLNNWLRPFISLSLFVDLAKEDRQESDCIFLITQHKSCSMLWSAGLSQASES
ncbi:MULTISPECIES: hypothetical protein [unclassified Psychrobacter]|uniref:hypothetical protein n=1 Tax=unclassified Psychrobacter TaxID=196806 RepID=UPI0025B3D251|nr:MULTISPECIES: hypothetical protein [unclassified Psychrobacter]MDN3453963.1 hypothetical protein [Psychrobacter sp. APC 3350]MDN3503167.1 hypothetical protein [Psychrobacter sp. 5A.1]